MHRHFAFTRQSSSPPTDLYCHLTASSTSAARATTLATSTSAAVMWALEPDAIQATESQLGPPMLRRPLCRMLPSCQVGATGAADPAAELHPGPLSSPTCRRPAVHRCRPTPCGLLPTGESKRFEIWMSLMIWMNANLFEIWINGKFKLVRI
jgi:hypothetical protein